VRAGASLRRRLDTREGSIVSFADETIAGIFVWVDIEGSPPPPFATTSIVTAVPDPRDIDVRSARVSRRARNCRRAGG
jgi:hypothetical protein